MKKIYLLFAILLITFYGLINPLSAQTTIADGLITLSTDASGPWYYFENGHNNDEQESGYINDKDGRFGTFITSSAGALTARIYTGEDSQKWRVVASGDGNSYFLIDTEGNYLYRIANNNYRIQNSAPGNEGKFEITVASEDPKNQYVKIKALTASNYIGRQNDNGGCTLIEGNAPGTIQENGLYKSPRAWRPVPENVISNFYPTYYENEEEITEWFYIKSLDTNITDASKYITVNSEGNLSLTSKSSSDKDSQLFGFTKLGNYRTQIISKATRSPLLNETNGWALRQVFSTNNPDQPIQGLIRTKVYGNSATITEQGYILTSSLIKEDYNRKLDFFDNKYTWAYEIATFNIEVNEGERITLTSPSSETIESGQSFTVTYQVESGFVPTVNINGIAHSVGTLNNGIYTLVLENITSDTSINISSEAAAYTVTVNVSDGISVQSPTLDPNKQYVAGTNSVIQFSLDEGYNNLQITTNGKATASDPEPTGNNNYVINLSNIQDGAEISINCLVISYNVNLTTDGVNVVGSPAEEANYFDEYTFSFTLEAGYNHPQVFVNQKYVKATEEEGTYQVSLSNVRENLIIAVKAFQLPQNTVPVLADTYIDGRTAAINYSASEDLRAQASTSTYNRISYLEFDATAIDISQYDKVYLQLVYKSRQSGKNADPIFQLRTVPSSVGELYQLNYNNSGEGSGVSRNGDPIGNPLTFDRTSAIETVVKFDITSYVLNNSASKLRLQLTGSSDNDAGFFNFYSSEGALNRNDLSLMPVLIFEAASNEWNGNIDNDWSNINNWNIPFLPSTDTEVKIPSGKANYPLLSANTTLKELIMEEEAEIKLADGVSLTIDGIVTIEKNVTQYIWYPIGFPFEARAYYMPYTPEEELIPFVEGVGGDFWLKDYNGTDGIFAYTAYPLAAGKGYIAQFPAMFNNETITYTSVNGPHIFSKTGLTVTENYQFLANPTLEEIDLPEMEGTYYYIYNPASSAFERKTSGTLKPFEAVIAVANPAELRSIIDLGEGYTGIDPKVITNTEYGPIKEVRYYNLQGIEIPEPTYLEACIVKTVYESGKQITQKFINIKNR